MRRLSLLATAATLLSLPAFAQSAYRSPDPAIQEMQREQTSPRMPYVPQQNRLRDQADAEGMQRPAQWVRQARQAVASGRLGQANELVERAETRILTRSTLASQAGAPMQDPALTRLSAAREALARQDRAGARHALDGALAVMTGSEVQSMGDADETETPVRPMRRHYMRDGNRSALDAPIVLAQGGGGGSGSTQSGGLGDSSPGSPGAGQIGSTPSVLPGTAVQPGQGTASPGMHNREVGAPLPGTSPNDPVNQRGNTGVSPGSRNMGTGSQR